MTGLGQDEEAIAGDRHREPKVDLPPSSCRAGRHGRELLEDLLAIRGDPQEDPFDRRVDRAADPQADAVADAQAQRVGAVDRSDVAGRAVVVEGEVPHPSFVAHAGASSSTSVARIASLVAELGS